jgi:CDP-paratose 2-epimerase
MSETVLVTGGAGFIGSSTALAIRHAFPDKRVVALDNLRRRGSELNLPRLAKAGVEFVHGDIRNPGDLEAIEPRVLIECSAEPSVLAGYNESPDYLFQTNLAGCYNCLELARKTKADLIFLSTSRVYPTASINQLRYNEQPTRYQLDEKQDLRGSSGRGISEEFSVRGARSLYGMTKLCAELMIEEYADAFGLQYVINRCGLVSGAWQMGKSDQGVIALWVAGHYFGKPLRYIGFGGSGKQVRDVLHVDDLTGALADQLRRFDVYANQTFNLGGGLGGSVSLLELTDICREVSGQTIPVEPDLVDRKADIRSFISDCSKVEATAGWRPQRSPTDVVSDIHRWIGENESLLRPILIAS